MARELRPWFEVRSDEAPSLLLERFRARLRSKDCPLGGYVAADRAVLHVPPSRQRLWSAELRLEVTTRDDGGGSVITGVYAPHPHVWVTYVILLAAVVVGVTVALVFALAEWSLNQRPVALYALIPLLVIGAIVYATAFIGQGFATHEMDELRVFLDETLEPSAELRSHVRHRRPLQRDAI